MISIWLVMGVTLLPSTLSAQNPEFGINNIRIGRGKVKPSAPSSSSASKQEPPASRPVNPSGARPSLTSLLERSLGAYPTDSKIFDNSDFRTRLVNLLGQNRFDTMKRYFEYDYPIEKGKKFYLVQGCRNSMCGTTDFEIQYYFNENVLCVKYTVDGHEEIFMEQPMSVRWHKYTDL